MALTSSRSAQRRGRPYRVGSGTGGARCTHSASVRSQGYRQDADAGEPGIGDLFFKGGVLAPACTPKGAWIRCGHSREIGGLWQGWTSSSIVVSQSLKEGICKHALTSVQQRLVKTGERVVKHARYYWLLLAEGHLTRRLFGAMARRIAALPVPAG